MTNHDAAAIAQHLYEEVWNAQRYEAADELFDSQFQTGAAPDIRGGAAKLAAIRGYHASFPDLRISIDDLVAAGDRVAARWTFTGTDTGGLKGNPPTGRSVRAWGVEHLGIRDGKIVSDWVGVDWLGVLTQLGAIPVQHLLGRRPGGQQRAAVAVRAGRSAVAVRRVPADRSA